MIVNVEQIENFILVHNDSNIKENVTCDEGFGDAAQKIEKIELS